ncbi:MAG: glycosyltransferase [Verrucomicrobiota bacterium]
MSKEDFTILLVGNYLPDGQRSMFRFRDLLLAGLQAKGLQVELFNPPVILGKLGARNRGLGKWIGYIDKYLLCSIFLKRKIASIQGQRIVHIVDHSNAFYTRWLSKETTVVTCHDLLAVRSALGEFKENVLGASGKQQQAMIVGGLKRAEYIVSVSKATCMDVGRLIGEKADWLHHIPNALDRDFIAEARGQADDKAALPSSLQSCRYVMHIGGEKWYKHRILALKVFAQLHQADDALRFVVVGPSYTDAQLLDAALTSSAKSSIIYLTGISDAELRAVYRHCELLLFLSLIEGFGWPILEAQACGCAVATLDREPMKELNANQRLVLEGELEDANWLSDASAQCQHYLEQSSEARAQARASAQRFAARFTNQESVEAYLALYREALQTTE